VKLCSLARAFAGENGRNRFRQDFNVHPEALTLDVIDIELDLPRKINLGAAADLPDARDARLYRQSPAMCQRVLRNLPRQWRARSDQRHISLEDVIKLRQFI